LHFPQILGIGIFPSCLKTNLVAYCIIYHRPRIVNTRLWGQQANSQPAAAQILKSLASTPDFLFFLFFSGFGFRFTGWGVLFLPVFLIIVGYEIYWGFIVWLVVGRFVRFEGAGCAVCGRFSTTVEFSDAEFGAGSGRWSYENN
jgi:hypothetical protein